VGCCYTARSAAAPAVVFVDDSTVPAGESGGGSRALKLFLDAEGCIFVLGWIASDRGAVQTRYKGELKAHDYLDKIIQLPFNLPPIEEAQMEAYVRAVRRNCRCALHPGVCAGAVAEPAQGQAHDLRLPDAVADHATSRLWRALRRCGWRRWSRSRKRTATSTTTCSAFARPICANWRSTSGRRTGSSAGRARWRGGAAPAGRLAEVCARADLRRLLCLFDDEDARFDVLDRDQIVAYRTLTRRAVRPRARRAACPPAHRAGDGVCTGRWPVPDGTPPSKSRIC